MAPARVAAGVLLAAIGCVLSVAADNPTTPSPQPFVCQKAHATFYGGADASDTMGGACGYGNLFSEGYGTRTAALSTVLFNDGTACGQCYKIACDRKRADPLFCKPGVTVTVTATNFCPPNDALPNNNGGWCNPPRPHFDMAQPAWEKIGVYKGGIIPVMYQSPPRIQGISSEYILWPYTCRVPCAKRGGVRFRINGHNYFNLVLVSNVAAAGSIKSMDVRALIRTTGCLWHAIGYSLANLTGKMLSFRLTNTDGHTLVFNNVVPKGWNFGQSFVSKLQF